MSGVALCAVESKAINGKTLNSFNIQRDLRVHVYTLAQ